MLKILSVLGILIASVHFASAGPELGSYDEFMQGAMVVYSNDIHPSIDNSVEFLEYLDAKWGSVSCSEQCYQTGYKEAKLFVAYKGIEDAKLQ
ncbi:lysis inhibition regulator membrane protein [Aeromonas phage Asfd_1]|nr:lysis inhibition regulator membrane protein [Aeromonas phage Asfd_1]